MTIDGETYKLSEKNYIPVETIKERIVIGNTYSSDMQHVKGWEKRWFGNYFKTSMFTIDINGKIYQHYPTKYFSNLLEDVEISKTSITILIENEGWLIKNEFGEFINYVGNIYSRSDEVFEKPWKTNRYWSPYTKNQLNSAVELVKKLCLEHNINQDVIEHNTYIEDGMYYGGVIYKSNINKDFNDISPSWDFKEFKNKIEK